MIKTRSDVTQPYCIVRSALGEDECQLASWQLRAASARHAQIDDQVVTALSFYEEFFCTAFQLRMQPELERFFGCRLLPTYTYARIYLQGAELKSHRDRPACEFSATLCLQQEPDEPWPIWLEVEGKSIEVRLQRGDMLLYRGCEQRHWRAPFAGRACVQAFLHYVDANGPHAEEAYDRGAVPTGKPWQQPPDWDEVYRAYKWHIAKQMQDAARQEDDPEQP